MYVYIYTKSRKFCFVSLFVTMGKDQESLEQSRRSRKRYLDMFGGELPTSILKYDQRRRATDLAVNSRSYSASAEVVKNNFPGRFSRDFSSSGQGSRNGALSRFPQNVGEAIIKFYLGQESGVIVDPFAGHNSRMELVLGLGHKYVGGDICKQFVEDDNRIFKHLEGKKHITMGYSGLVDTQVPSAIVANWDARSLPVASNIADFIITSPPYWDIEFYDNSPGQLGLSSSYEHFLEEMAFVITESFRVLKPNCFCAYFINDFRKEGRFYPYHMHIAGLFKRAGFELWDCLIVDLNTSFLSIFFQPSCEA